jgi:diamine N-acetyltransferase
MIRLVAITKHNWKECVALSVAEHQADFVPTNLYSIAETQFYPDACPLAIYNQSHQMVGFVLYGRDDDSGKWKIFRLMIDAAHQRKGYAATAMKQIIALLAQKPDGHEILIRYHIKNHAARHLYERLGFVEVAIEDNVATAVFKASI